MRLPLVPPEVEDRSGDQQPQPEQRQRHVQRPDRDRQQNGTGRTGHGVLPSVQTFAGRRGGDLPQPSTGNRLPAPSNFPPCSVELPLPKCVGGRTARLEEPVTTTLAERAPIRYAPAPVPAPDPDAVARVVARVRDTVYVVRDGPASGIGVALAPGDGHEVVGTLPPLYPEWLGDRSFCEAHGVRFPYVAGEMANGIATTKMVVAMARAGMLGFFGAGGLAPDAVEQAVGELAHELGDLPNWGVNLIHSPNEQSIEERVAELLVERRVPIVSASAFMALTPAVVRCAVSGLQADAGGSVVRRARVFAKVSRPEGGA